MTRANPFDPKNSSVNKIQYVTPTDDDDAFIEAYPSGQTLLELSPKGVICKPNTLEESPTTW